MSPYLLALYSNKPGGKCLSHVDTEGITLTRTAESLWESLP